jgi:hypothetical protein
LFNTENQEFREELPKASGLGSRTLVSRVVVQAVFHFLREDPENQRNLTGASLGLMFECVID